MGTGEKGSAIEREDYGAEGQKQWRCSCKTSVLFGPYVGVVFSLYCSSFSRLRGEEFPSTQYNFPFKDFERMFQVFERMFQVFECTFQVFERKIYPGEDSFSLVEQKLFPPGEAESNSLARSGASASSRCDLARWI